MWRSTKISETDFEIFYSLVAVYVTYDANDADCTSHPLKKSQDSPNETNQLKRGRKRSNKGEVENYKDK